MPAGAARAGRRTVAPPRGAVGEALPGGLFAHAQPGPYVGPRHARAACLSDEVVQQPVGRGRMFRAHPPPWRPRVRARPVAARS
jgi:hypothetical protein